MQTERQVYSLNLNGFRHSSSALENYQVFDPHTPLSIHNMFLKDSVNENQLFGYRTQNRPKHKQALNFAHSFIII